MQLQTNGEGPPHFPSVKEHLSSLKKYMEESNISYGELARELGMVDKSQVSRWFNGYVEPRLSTLKKVEKALAKIAKRRSKQ